MHCEGNACDAVRVAWDPTSRVYIVENHSDQAVRLVFRTWTGVTEILLNGGECRPLQMTEFDVPFVANYA